MSRPNNHFLFDANLLAFKAVHQSTAAVGSESLVWDEACISKVLSDIRLVLFKFMPDKATIIWDGGRSKRRKEIFPEYKKTPNRESRTAEDLQGMRQAMGKLTKILRKLSCRVVSIPGKEADDVIAFITTEIGGGTVVSDDRDFLQLVDSGVRVYRFSEDKMISAPFFFDELGIYPDQFLLSKAIIGDASDNIAGVPMVGEGTATKLLSANPDIKTARDLRVFVEGFVSPKKREQSLRDSLHIVERNLDLMDMRGEVFSQSEGAAIKAAIVRETKLDESVLDDFMKMGMGRVAMQFTNWVMPFRRLL